MGPFRFRLERVLAWRRAQLEIQESTLRRLHAAAEEAGRAMVERDEERLRSGRACIEAPSLDSTELVHVDRYRSRLEAEKQALSRRREELRRQAEVERGHVLEARRRFRLLERLRERRLAEWRLEEDRELERLSTESYLARWSRDRL